MQAREYWAETKDARGALALMPRHMTIEVAALRVLDKQGPQVREIGKTIDGCRPTELKRVKPF